MDVDSTIFVDSESLIKHCEPTCMLAKDPAGNEVFIGWEDGFITSDMDFDVVTGAALDGPVYRSGPPDADYDIYEDHDASQGFLPLTKEVAEGLTITGFYARIWSDENIGSPVRISAATFVGDWRHPVEMKIADDIRERKE